jgi:uncharacterized HAD superfamily protein
MGSDNLITPGHLADIIKAYKKDEGKPRMDLLDPEFLVDVAKVLTMGSGKYDQSQKVYQNNWRQGGMRWGQVYAAAQRHMNAFWSGEEIDDESGLPHVAHAACNMMFLHYYARNARHLDDRDLDWRRQKRIFLDIDGVIADWGRAMHAGVSKMFPDRTLHVDETGEALHWGWLSGKLWHDFRESIDWEDFMLNDIEPLCDSNDWNFEPSGYVTHRNVANEISTLWLEKNGFPAVKCHTVDASTSKVELLLELQADIFVDDKFDTFVDVNDAGILCYLMDAPWNRKYDVGAYRIHNLNEIK